MNYKIFAEKPNAKCKLYKWWLCNNNSGTSHSYQQLVNAATSLINFLSLNKEHIKLFYIRFHQTWRVFQSIQATVTVLGSSLSAVENSLLGTGFTSSSPSSASSKLSAPSSGLRSSANDWYCGPSVYNSAMIQDHDEAFTSHRTHASRETKNKIQSCCKKISICLRMRCKNYTNIILFVSPHCIRH